MCVKLPGRRGPKGDSDSAQFYGSRVPLAAAVACTCSCLHLLLSGAGFNPAHLPLFYGTCAFMFYKTFPTWPCSPPAWGRTRDVKVWE